MTWLEFAKAEAVKLGVYLPDDIADYLLWEHTAFGVAGQEVVGGQLRDLLNERLYQWQVAYPPPDPTGPSRFERIANE